MPFVKVVRVLEYVGPKQWLAETLKHCAVQPGVSPGSYKDFGNAVIRERSRLTTPIPDCETCRGTGRMRKDRIGKLTLHPAVAYATEPETGVEQGRGGPIPCPECDGRGWVEPV